MEQNKMAAMPMPKLVANLSLPLMVSLLVQSLYNIVDSIFVAWLEEAALTATSLAYPIQMLMIAVAVGTGVGVNALLSRSIGAGQAETTQAVSATGVLLAGAGAVCFALLGLLCGRQFAGLFTSDPLLAALCGDYLTICMVFCGGTFLGTMFQRFLQAVGNAFHSMVSLIAGAVTNLILDPLLIFGLFGLPALGVKGAAIATVIGQWVAALVAILLNFYKNPAVPVTFRGFRPQRAVLAQIYRVGLPTVVTQALGSVMLLAVNALLIRFSSTAVAFFGAYYKLQSFLFMPMNGLGQAAIPIVGYNYGAKNYPRVLDALRTTLPAAIGISLLATAVFCALPGPLLNLFSASGAMLEMGIPALRIIAVTFPFASATMVLGYALSGLGNGFVNMLSAALRQVVVLVPLMYLLSALLGVGCAWYAFWAAEAAACLYAALMARRILRQKGILCA